MSELTSNPSETPTTLSDRSQPPRSPKAVLSVSREEFYGQDPEHEPLELIVKEGLTDNECQLPDDLQGHVFGAAGSIDSPNSPGSDCVVEPYKSGWTPLYNGDGIIYRLDFHKTPQSLTQKNVKQKPGKAWMATRIVKTPDYYADLALHNNPKYQKQWPHEYKWLKFRQFGLARFSIKLGVRNFLNTACLRMKFANGSERLLVTWDAGRPYEINPSWN
ncbi:carotenoid oxygenase family protein [Microseira wollei]|uniref:Uncharacterized protein n=1 Tax=Microseira wollei NIES-4236 TaxID=2530354 RepID=A0AAV3XBZ4_9CYAN|nr:carotenoid oxygenase family protein [Microseira wollei]GET39723.1 hypothetical protein MiSe_44950 [Microseira wollei NIES-4236]